MINFGEIQGIIFDYGATIDSNGKHWFEVFWDCYKGNQVPVTKEIFWEAYVYSERYLATHLIIKSKDTFKEVLLTKTSLQISWLISEGFLTNDNRSLQYSFVISNQCYNFVCSVLEEIIPVLQNLADKYPLVLISNFYGNIKTVLKDFGLDSYFKTVIESAVVKMRKPNPLIFNLGVKALGLKPEKIVVIGDSYKKDIFPARTIGCQTIWIKGISWKEELKSIADAIIYDFKELNTIFEQKKLEH